jgi:hypothetical protein
VIGAFVSFAVGVTVSPRVKPAACGFSCTNAGLGTACLVKLVFAVQDRATQLAPTMSLVPRVIGF